MAKKGQSDDKNIELIEDPNAIAERITKSEEFVKKNKDMLSYLGIALAVLIGGGIWYYNNIKEQEQIAQEEMFQAVFYFEADSINKALNGDGVNEGFEYIIEQYDQYGLNKTANLAKFYAGVCYLKLGNYEQAIDYLSDFSASDYLVQGRAYALIGDAHMEQGDFDKAIKFYKKAADYKPNQYFTPTYLMKLGLASEKSNDYPVISRSDRGQ